VPHPGGILSIDLMGPYTLAYSPQYIDRPSVKYALVGAFLPPTKPELVVRSMLEKHAKLDALNSDLWRLDPEDVAVEPLLGEETPQPGPALGKEALGEETPQKLEQS